LAATVIVNMPEKGKSQRGGMRTSEHDNRRASLGRYRGPGGMAMLFFRRSMVTDLDFMQLALEEARAAALAGEVPVGALLVRDGQVISRVGNRTIRDCDPTAHAEVVALREAARVLGNYRLAATILYVTIEPCSMCAGAIIQARVPRVVYGCDDPKGGGVRSCFEILSHPRLNHQVEVTSGVLAAECAAVIQSFFAERR
jgi:tRNA(adenine34) deaminase